ncbi:PAS domain-containing protein [Undibacterium sp. Ren11W]|uniref:PAS domain-containing protein n=1 Tax=Undibacterium sp. Ren11W TaxID=3413045 RepID=UPI003BF01CD5
MNSDPQIDATQDEWLIDDDVPEHSAEQSPEMLPWRVLIVDDDVDVHVVTKFSLRNATFKNRPLNFLHAYSAKEGLHILRDTPEVALVLLDVVMETENAGLLLARQIRGELNNQLVRIVLRTGQSGLALEQSVIVDYDINDYRTKSDLTTQKLFTTVISSLRAYDSLQNATQSHFALQLAMAKIKELRAGLDRHAPISIADEHGKLVYVNDKFCTCSHYTRQELIGMDYLDLLIEAQRQVFLHDIWRILQQGQTWHGELQARLKDGSTGPLDCSIVPLLDTQGKPYHYLAIYSAIGA